MQKIIKSIFYEQRNIFDLAKFNLGPVINSLGVHLNLICIGWKYFLTFTIAVA